MKKMKLVEKFKFLGAPTPAFKNSENGGKYNLR